MPILFISESFLSPRSNLSHSKHPESVVLRQLEARDSIASTMAQFWVPSNSSASDAPLAMYPFLKSGIPVERQYRRVLAGINRDASPQLQAKFVIVLLELLRSLDGPFQMHGMGRRGPLVRCRDSILRWMETMIPHGVSRYRMGELTKVIYACCDSVFLRLLGYDG